MFYFLIFIIVPAAIAFVTVLLEDTSDIPAEDDPDDYEYMNLGRRQ